MNTVNWGLAALVLLLTLALGVDVSKAQRDEAVFFPETGHWVSGEFLKTYRTPGDPLALFGFPITESFPEPGTDRTIQYFQKARFVLDPGSPPELRVQRTPLGELLYSPGTPLPYPENYPGCNSYPETGFQVCFAFLDFYNAHGKVAQFGYPISNFEMDAGRIVQYFQRARFEWHPELPSGQRVVLGDIGLEYFHKIKEDPRLLIPNLTENIPQTILRLRVRAFPRLAVIPLQAKQTLFVAVQDQNLRPVGNAQVEFQLWLPSGASHTLQMAPTDANGITKSEFQVDSPLPGMVEILVTTKFDNFVEKTRTFFRFWW